MKTSYQKQYAGLAVIAAALQKERVRPNFPLPEEKLGQVIVFSSSLNLFFLVSKSQAMSTTLP